ncbi:IlvD/Edd family dehydratase [Herbaspirillum huttiense]|jgi:L-arabinonate dehydratase (EC 4.2.1.25)|uniref:IlvD/Edd family dehydratase n=1 Tax=Herbaspirillum huttiense subsp. lycopersici TaxID=3074428 RepID=A0ABU2EN53_9BURK|nr:MULTISPECIES: IlvD/Edd family dehydratase [Herbaspirillum]MAF04535.1 dihydroxy-acid dehydratase [Herbaspirillum sp.]MBN9357138.1 dihydroxy-acid dehydratase [Herbaspirillum huttiense]MBO18047.1 dihydroxy-acid dehydratase [Herbaspirillum sp.]MBP1315326.1 dihydroxy-acid dehydratase/L-arabonate dehydrase [Herbaspirillum sp. 1130]MCO4859170.1 dihydroxy-acid dehydratase [Herbaspirillum sp. WGmk3]|tara:strand:- start:6104 stop:7861 length:1758 start_codon:yes stop_codon:yes gene_type:complete
MSSDKKDKSRTLRSAGWFGTADKNGFMYRSWMKNQGIPDHEFQGKPVIGICNTWSELTPCNAHFRKIAEHVRRGIIEAGGFPVEFPVFSNGESNLRPTAMLTRNLASMDVEESIRGNPIDGVVLLTGCDKTTPALLMGAASCDVPAIVVTGGPMLNGKHQGRDIGSGTVVWQLSEQVKAGEITIHDFMAAEAGMSRSAGTCNTMGTASTMACMAESLGVSLPHNAAIPAVDARRYVLAHLSGMRIVDMVWEGLTLSKILTRKAFENAIRTNAAIGGSTNAVIHLKAIAGRIGVDLELEDWTRIGRGTPTIVDLQPSGRYLMEEFYYAGGLPAVLRRMGEADLLPHKDALTVNGQTMWDNVKDAPIYNDEVVRPLAKPLIEDGGICILRGNLAPRGAVLKPSAATPELMKHRGRAVVFEDFAHYKERINDPDLDVDASCVLVMKNVGPKGYPGMAEVGNMGLPPKVLATGVKDMVRISDARMSGTAYGTVILHVAPEAAAGGPLGIVQDGDFIELDAYAGKLQLDISEEEMQRRLAERAKVLAERKPEMAGGYQSLYVDRVLQADEGCDFDFLVGCRGAAVPKHSH